MTNTSAPTAIAPTPAAWQLASVAAPAPLEPAPGTPYQHLFREPDRRWWRPLASLGIFLASYIAVLIVLGIIAVVAIVFAATSAPDPEVFLNSVTGLTNVTGWTSVGVLLVTNVALAALIPTVLLANKVAHRLPAGYTHSVAGTFRWRWFGLVTAALLPLWGLYLAIAFALEPLPLFSHAETPAVTVALIAVVLLTTPLQAAGEEYFFRGWLLQNVGMWIPRPVVALVIPTVISAALFALAHGSLDPWIVLSLAATAVAAAWLTWRTGGLEAAVSLHAVNNVLIFVIQALLGVPMMTSTIGEQSVGTWVGGLMGLVSSLAAVAVVEWLARRRGIAPTR